MIFRDSLKLLPERCHLVSRLAVLHPAFVVDAVDGEVTVPLKVPIRVQDVTIEPVDGGRRLVWAVAIAHELLGDGAIVAIGQCVIGG